jgi:deoxyribonuclease-4
MHVHVNDLLGARFHAGRRPYRARALEVIGATAIQVFTKTPNQWRIRSSPGTRANDSAGVAENRCAGGSCARFVPHQPGLARCRAKSTFRQVFHRRTSALPNAGIRAVVSHPGNYLDDRDPVSVATPSRTSSVWKRCRGPSWCCWRPPREPTALGSSFEELAEIRAKIPTPLRKRIGFCADTCHLYAAGYDLVRDYEGIWQRWDDLIGLKHLRCLHLNDSKTPLGSRRDRHELIGEGSLGLESLPPHHDRSPFQPGDESAETPKGDDLVTSDRKMLRRLRGYGRRGRVDLHTIGRSFLGDAIQPHRAGARPHAHGSPSRPREGDAPVAGWHLEHLRSSPITSSTTSTCNQPWHRS